MFYNKRNFLSIYICILKIPIYGYKYTKSLSNLTNIKVIHNYSYYIKIIFIYIRIHNVHYNTHTQQLMQYKRNIN